jgi:hypothetical protein
MSSTFKSRIVRFHDDEASRSTKHHLPLATRLNVSIHPLKRVVHLKLKKMLKDKHLICILDILRHHTNKYLPYSQAKSSLVQFEQYYSNTWVYNEIIGVRLGFV